MTSVYEMLSREPAKKKKKSNIPVVEEEVGVGEEETEQAVLNLLSLTEEINDNQEVEYSISPDKKQMLKRQFEVFLLM